LLVKEDSKSKGSSIDIGDFSDLVLFSSSTNVNNEIGTIKSPDIMRDVVKRLHLDVVYSQLGTFHRETVYGDQLPVVVAFKNLPDLTSASFKMYIDNGDVINEAFRVVRTNVEFMLKSNSGDKGYVLMMLSSYVGSGKTFICYNLAKSLALKGKKVICLDLDMRKASLSFYIKSPKVGISNYLANQVGDYKSIIHQIEDEPNMFLMLVGTIPPNPTELLFNERFGKMIAELREDYDYVFIDCPPTEIVAGSDIINKHVDDTLFIVRAGRFDRSMLPVVEKYYIDKKYCNMSLVLNGTEAYSHYGSYKYGYGKYGYGYGSYG